MTRFKSKTKNKKIEMQNNSKTVSILLLQIFLLSLIFIPIIFTFTKIFGQSEISSTNKLPQFNIKWGSYGTGNGQFISPSGIAVDSSNNVYVVDAGNNRIQKFTSNGTFITTWGSYGTGNGQFISPSGIAVDSSNNVYVVDAGNNRIEIFVS